MGKVITKSNEHQKGSLSLETIQDFFMVLYMFAICAHQTNIGFDFYFSLCSFIGFFGFGLLSSIQKKRFRINGFLVWFLMFVFYSYLSASWAPSSAVQGIFDYTSVYLQIIGSIWCIINRVNRFEDIEKICKYILVALFYTCILIFFLTPFDAWGTQRVGSIVGLNPNDLGMRMAVGITLSLYFVIQKKKSVYIILYVAFFSMVMFSGSRKALFLALASSILCLIFVKKENLTSKVFIKKLFILLVIAFLIIIVYYLVMKVKVFYDVIGFRLETMLDSFNGDAQADNSMYVRNLFIKHAWNLFLDHPLLGYGLDSFEDYMVEINFGYNYYSHNNFVEILSTLGSIGFLIFYSMECYRLVNLSKMFFNRKNLQPLLFYFLLIDVFMLVLSWWMINYYSKFFMFIYALIFMYIKLCQNDIKQRGVKYKNE